MADDSNSGWMSDVQRAIAIILVGSFCFITIFATICIVFFPQASVLADMAKTNQSSLVNMGLIALGFFFGNTMAKLAQDTSQQKIVDKLTPAPTSSATAPIVAWWTKLSDSEKTAITNAQGLGSTTPDARVSAFVSASQVGAATPDDLAYLVSRGLLTQARANEIKGAA